jgi:hypothetical protein
MWDARSASRLAKGILSRLTPSARWSSELIIAKVSSCAFVNDSGDYIALIPNSPARKVHLSGGASRATILHPIETKIGLIPTQSS